MRKALILAFLLVSSSYAQTAVYPGSVATSAQLMQAANLIQSTLASSIGNTDTSIPVLSPLGFVSNGLITIDQEVIAVCNVVGTNLIIGKSSCPNIDGRGFDSTAAVPHNSGVTVSMFIVAWHHNALTAEVEAIEQTLGANLGNVVRAGTQPANTFLMGPSTGSPANPTFRAVTAVDLVPAGTLTNNTTGAAGRISGLTTQGSGSLLPTLNPGWVSPNCVRVKPDGTLDATGSLVNGCPDTTNASNITSGTLSGARLPAPTVSVLGGVLSRDCSLSSQLVQAINSDGSITCGAGSGSGNVTGPGPVTNGYIARWGGSPNTLTTGSPASVTSLANAVVLLNGSGKLDSSVFPASVPSTSSGVTGLATQGSGTSLPTFTGSFTTANCVVVQADGTLYAGGAPIGGVSTNCAKIQSAGVAGQIPQWVDGVTLSPGLPVGVTPTPNTVLFSNNAGVINANWLPPTISANTTGSAASITGKTFLGPGPFVQTGSGTYTPNDCIKFGAGGDLVDAGAPCGSGGGGSVNSVSGDGTLINNSLSTGAVTLTLATAGAHKYFGNNTGSTAAPGYVSIVAGDLPATVVLNNQANTYSSGLQSFAAGNITLPAGAGFTASSANNIGYDTTNTNVHVYDGADGIVAPFASAPTTGHCVSATVSAGKVTLADAGGACSVGGGGGTVSSGTSPQLAYYSGSTTVSSTADFTYNTHTLTMGASGLLDLSAATTANAFKVPVGAGLTAGANGVLAYDSTNGNLHTRTASNDGIVGAFIGSVTNNDCVKISIVGAAVALGDSGAPCTASSIPFSSVTTGTSNNQGLAVSTGSYLIATNSGYIQATSVPYEISATEVAGGQNGCGITMGGSDQTSALNSCLNTMGTDYPNGFVIKFPPGVVGLCDLNVTQFGAVLEGAGGYGSSSGNAHGATVGTVFKSTCSSGTHSVIHFKNCRGCSVKNAGIDSNSTSGVRNIQTTDVNSGVFENLDLGNGAGDAMWYWESLQVPGYCNGGGGTYRNINIYSASNDTSGVVFGANYKGNWSSSVTYAANDAVTFSGREWISQSGGNLNNTPALGSAFWDFGAYQGTWNSGTTYSVGQGVTYTDANGTNEYTSLVNSNLNFTPTAGGPYWKRDGFQDSCSQDWSHLGVIAGGNLDAHDIYFRYADSNNFDQVEASSFGPTVSSIVVGTGTCGGTSLSASQACVGTTSNHGLAAGALTGVFLNKGTGNGSTPGLYGDFVATGADSTHVILTLPNGLTSGTYCSSSGACGTTIASAPLMFGNAWDNSFHFWVGSGMNWINPENSNQHNSNLGNAISAGNWPEMCGGDYTCTYGFMATGINYTGTDGTVWNPQPMSSGGNFTSKLNLAGDFTQTPPGESAAMYIKMLYPASRGTNNYYGIRVDTADPSGSSAPFKVTNTGNGDSFYSGNQGSGSGSMGSTSFATDVNYSTSGFGTYPCVLGIGCEKTSSSSLSTRGLIIYDWSYSPSAEMAFEVANVSGGANPLGRFGSFGDSAMHIRFYAGHSSQQEEGIYFDRYDTLGPNNNGAPLWFLGSQASGSVTATPFALVDKLNTRTMFSATTGSSSRLFANSGLLLPTGSGALQIQDAALTAQNTLSVSGTGASSVLNVAGQGGVSFYTTNGLQFSIGATGALQSSNLAGGGKRLLCVDNSGNIYGASGTSCP